jgi:uncharacterized metal-binding protein YceD (DUF177 family)
MKDRKAQQKGAHGDAALNAVSWTAPVSVSDVPPTGRHIVLKPDEDTRKAIAKAAEVLAVPRLEAVFELAPHGSDGLRVTGRVKASVEQNCVVTLEPLKNEVDEEVDLVFKPPRELPKASEPVEDSGVVAGSPAVNAPEELENGAVDLAALTVEFLIVGIDPYPRKPGASFESPEAGEPGPNPFAALAALKKDR